MTEEDQQPPSLAELAAPRGGRQPLGRPGDAGNLGTLRRVRAGVLDVAFHESGPDDGPAVLLLHGFP